MFAEFHAFWVSGLPASTQSCLQVRHPARIQQPSKGGSFADSALGDARR
jgi:hypothetical protein